MPKKINPFLRGAVFSILFLTLSFHVFAQKSVSGTITNGKDRLPVPGATVAVKGSQTATQTDANGAFKLTVPSDRSVLVVTAIGFETIELSTSGKSAVSAELKETSLALNEIVVTGYTSQRKKDITGSVAVVNVTNLKSVPSGTTESLLQGQAPGVTVINSGVPGGGSTVRIRGITSVGGNDPLVIIDGTPGSMHDLNVNDIESIQVLKDAGAAAIYGVRGSNGVVVITTKRGRSGKARINYDGYIGTQRPNKDGYRMANTMETALAVQQSFVNAGVTPANKQYGTGTTPVVPKYITPTASNTADPATYALYTNQITLANQQGTDWYHEIFKPATMQSHSLSVSTGSDRSTFYMSLGYLNQQGTLINTYLKRYSARINSTFNVNNRIRIGENIYAFYKQNPGFTNQNEGNAISHSYRENPIIPVYDIKGNFAGTGSQGLGNAQNPVANQMRSKDNKGNDWQITGNAFAEVDLLKHLTLRTSFGGTIDNYYYNSFSYTAYENAENNKNPNSFQENFGYNSSWTWNSTANYTNNFGDHSIKVLVGTEAISSYGRAIQGVRSGYFITNTSNLTVDPNLWTLNFGPPAGQTTSNINGTPYRSSLYSLFGKLDYGFQDKYLLSGTIRRDGSSAFGANKKFGYFPSVSGAWRISKENFMKDITWLDDLKIRGGWGKLGSISNINPTNAYTLYNASAANSYYDINGANTSSLLGIYPSQIGDPNTSWEQDILSNIGIDASLARKWDVSFELYKKDVSGLIFAPLNDVTLAGGATAPFVNVGNISNKGIDAAVTYHGTAVHNDLKFDVSVNFTTYSNKVVSLPPGIKYYDQNSDGSSRLGSFSRLQAGQSVGEFFGLEEIGLFKDATDVSKSPPQEAAAPGRLKFRDVNGDGKVDINDRTFFGNPNPKFTTGVTLGANYKNFDFSMFVYASVGAKAINYIRYWTDFPQVFDGAVSKDALYNSWTPTHTDARVPRLERAANFSTTGNFNSYYMEDGGYLRCKSLNLGYTVAARGLKRVGIERLRIYVQATNLFTITKYTGIDPELPGANLGKSTTFGIDLGDYPANQKQFNIGANLSF
jgi:TonB-linked SusC/RagA family outer membrane protein